MRRRALLAVVAFLLAVLPLWAQGDSIPSAANAAGQSLSTDALTEDFFRQYLRHTPEWRKHRTTKAVAWTSVAVGPALMYGGLLLTVLGNDAGKTAGATMLIGGAGLEIAAIPLFCIAHKQVVRGCAQAYDLMPDDIRPVVYDFRHSRDFKQYRLWKGLGETSLTLGILAGTAGSLFIYLNEHDHKKPLYTPALVPAGVLIAGSIPCFYLSRNHRQQAVGNALSLSLTANPIALTSPCATWEQVPTLGVAVNF